MENIEEILEKTNQFLITSMVSKLEPVVIKEARGALIEDIAGKQYIDCFAGISVVNIGHCHPEIQVATINQLKKLVHACSYVYHVIPTVQLAEKLAQITPLTLNGIAS